MKKPINKITLFTIIVTLLAATSCKKSFFSEVNNNPNAPDPNSITPGVLLTPIEASLAYTVGGELSRYSSILTQQTKGVFTQAAAQDIYTFTTNDFDVSWGNLYTSVLENNIKLREICDAKGYNRYGGVSRILTAYTLQLIVDHWGDAPYSQALKGDVNLRPAFDDDQGLYDTVQNLLTRAITLLNNPSAGMLVPGADDFIYGGDASKWIKFAHALKARLYIHQSKGNTTMANNALAELALSFTSNADNAQFSFSTVGTGAGPWYQFNAQRASIQFAPDAFYGIPGSTLYDEMEASTDPRLTVYFDPTFTVNIVGMGAYYGNSNSPVEFISLDEVLFMKAEATLRSTGSLGSAQPFFQQAIDSNMVKLGVAPGDRATYIVAHGTLTGSTANAIAQVAGEEHIALFLNPEVWTLWRRTGSPALVSTVPSLNIPRRFYYPQSELSNNGANTPAATLQSPKIFWDN